VLYKTTTGNPDRVIVCTHGHSSDGSQFDSLIPLLLTFANVLVMYDGVNPLATAAGIVRELHRWGLWNKQVFTYGISMGGCTSLRFQKLFCDRYGRLVEGMILYSVPRNWRSVVWDHPLQPFVVWVLRGGVVTRLLRLAGVFEGHPVSEPASGRLLTARRPRTRRPATPILVFLETDDDLVIPGDWEGFGVITTHTLKVVGHALIEESRDEVAEQLNAWFARHWGDRMPV